MRWVKRILVVVIVLGLALGVYGTYLVRRSFPTVAGDIAVSGLDAEVEVIRDRWGVPHIYASTPHDLFFAQGYIHAQERFWQMDFWRHIGSARLSELFGESQVETDLFLRSLGFAELARQELETMNPADRQVLEWYAEGVNTYLGEHRGSQISLEYAILPLQNSGYQIEEWTPIHTLTWAKLMSWDLSGNLRDEVARTVLARKIPIERVEQLFPPYPEDHPVIVPDDQKPSASPGVVVASVPDEAIPVLASAARAAERVWALTGGGFEGIGSNNWVVSGTMTASGMPLLANDPHLGIQMPSIWFANGLHCIGTDPECAYQLVGFSFPGSPAVVIGHNDRIAWGVTTQVADTQDLYIERVNPEDPNQYDADGGWVDFERRTETIRVAGGDDVVYEVMSTRHGPVISGTFLEEGEFDESAAVELSNPYVVTLAWQTLKPSTLVEAVLGINRATNHDEFRASAAKWDIAAQNLVYADVEGNIAYQATGENPVRANGDGRYPVSGWTGGFEWVGMVPSSELPWMLNPGRGYIATANQMVTRPGSGPYLGGDSSYGYRGARIEALLATGALHDVASMQRLQLDSLDGGAVHLVPHLLAVSTAGNAAVGEVQDVLRSWSEGPKSFQTAGGSPGAAAYQAIWRHLLLNLFGDEVEEDHLPDGGGRWFQVVRMLLAQPDDPWWDDITTDAVESRDDILLQAMIEAHEELTQTLGPDPSAWSWGELHIAEFRNQTFGQSGIAPIEWLFNRTAPARVGGSDSIINAVGWDVPTGFRVDWLPSMRMVVDLADFDASTFIHTTGQSGHAFHSHYDDLIEPWTDGEQIPMLWSRERVVAEAEATMTLIPEPG